MRRLLRSIPEASVVAEQPVMARRGSAALVVGYPHEDVGQWEALPGALEEAAAIGVCLGCSPLTGASATKAAVLAQLEQASVVHMATHGDVNRDGRARLLLHGSEQWLQSEDIQHLKMRAQLVVLSACQSGRGQVQAGEGVEKSSHEGVLGLARALMMAGVPMVIVALWPLPDTETKALMQHLYGYG